MKKENPVVIVEGRVQRKRRETHDRIAKAAIKLFRKLGYEDTTMDAIAEAADVSRRSLFHYFPSKEDVAFANQEKFLAVVVEEMRRQPMESSWPALIECAMVHAIVDAASPENIAINKLVRCTPALQSRYQRKYVLMEQAIASVLVKRSNGDAASRTRAELLAAVFTAWFRIATDDASGASIKDHGDAQQKVPEAFRQFWQSLLAFGEEGLAYHAQQDYLSGNPDSLAAKKGNRKK
ncbi:TetR/AcrR family transcriptional regulator [Collimonas fungivorans]|uniref:TetR/AcrR family transcriptional regulator n=1 Tax=Collimonas fungivorans TaxID=158899 RepID=UPI00167FB194|nr:TetR/AcrR family transcriptional regulator [Collimonas fungivorans]